MKKIEQNIPDIFNILRALAVLCIYIIHSVMIIKAHYPDVKIPWGLYTPAWGGIWILFALSGYLLGKGFYNNKYKTDFNGIKEFWLNRIIRIVPMYWFFLLLTFLFVNPQWFINENIKVLIPLFTFTYNGIPGIDGVGATWFISTIMQLYLLAPLVYKFIFAKIKTHQIWILLLIIGLGMGLRCLADLFDLDYYRWNYTFSLSNLDIFFGGMFLNALTQKSFDNKYKKILRPIAFIILFIIIIAFTHKLSMKINWFYKYIAPSIFLSNTLLIVYLFDVKDKIKSLPLTFNNVVKNPLRFIEAFGIISFGFYLYHSIILHIIPGVVSADNPTALIFGTIIGTFIITTIWATCIYFMIEKPSNKFRYSLTRNNNK